MAVGTTMNSWEIIRDGVSDTERLIGQRQYNLAMMKARQTLEFMVKSLAERHGIGEGDMAEMIDDLNRYGLISSSTCEHYHKIRMIGNKAAHEGSSSAADANTVYHLLSQEVYAFARGFSVSVPGAASSQKRRPTSSRSGESRYSSSGQRRRNSGQNGNKRRRKYFTSPEFLFKAAMAVIFIILAIAMFKLVMGRGKNSAKEESSAAETLPVVETQPVIPQMPKETETEAPETSPAETEAPAVYVTTSNLNVRKEPSTDAEKIGVIETGKEISFVRDHDETWAVISYEGKEAYVAKAYIRKKE